MIVGKLKPIEEIASSISAFKNVLILGCGSCVTVCLSGGDREAHALARELSRDIYYKQDPPSFKVGTFQRQCERDLIKAYLDLPPDTDAILSLACGAGVRRGGDPDRRRGQLVVRHGRPLVVGRSRRQRRVLGQRRRCVAIRRHIGND